MPDRTPDSGSLEDEPLPVPPSSRHPANRPASIIHGADPFSSLRLRGGDSSLGYDQDEDEASSAEDDVAPPPRRTAVSRPRNGPAISGFQPGAIVRVKVENFVTYEEAEFFLGPNLNMVIGPNGTGKSSLVCAICLGLGYSSSVLGRASAFGEFVKHGKDEAGIEVELQKLPEHSENPIVGLSIRREDNSRKFTINGQRASHKEIQKLMRSLKIQIDNLCQFLPQDKVAEFAALTPIELLEKTLHAAAPEEMLSWRAQLKDHFKLQKDTEHNGEKIREELRKMEARQQVLQADVEKLRERKAIQEAIEDYNKLRVVVKYYDARNRFKEAKVRKVDAERSLKRLYDSVAPALEAVNSKQEYQAKVKLVVADRQRRLQTADAAANTAIGQVEAVQARCQELAGRKEAEHSNFVAKKQELGRLRKKITDLEASHRQAPPEFDAADWNRKIREQEHQGREKEAARIETGEEIQRIRHKAGEIREQLSRLQTSEQELDSQQGQLLTQLRRINNDVAKGWEWLKDNQQSFEKEVFGPPMLTCSVRDKRYTDLVQSILQADDFLCFTAQTKEDHKKLSNQFYGEMGLSVTIRSCFTQYSTFKPPLVKEELSSLGFDGYVSDYLDGPEPVLAMLCSERKMHASAVSIRDITDEQFDQIQRAEKLIQFAAGRQLYRITRRREYGPGAVSTRVTQFAKGRFWADQPVDATEKTELRQKIDELTSQRAVMKEHYDAMNEKYKKAEVETRQISDKITELRSAKSELQREYTRWQTLPDKIESERTALRRTEEELTECKGRRLELEKLQDQIALDKAKAVLQHHRQIMGIRKAREALLEAQIVLMEAESELGVLKAKNSEITQQLEESKRSLKQIIDELNQQRNIAAEAKEEAVSILTEENKDELRDKAMGKTVEDIDQAIQVEQTKLEVIQASNPAALEEYERYAARIERERVNQANHEIKMAELDERIRHVKSQWEPRLDQLVSQINDAFSYNFEQISCAGEVGVHKDEDFEKWAIEIRVKFRENETLQRLDQHRQSGGERAVSTIFYLMALQSMAQAPFRVVDEINQGMDPRNERMVHERMVEVACREHTSQYFLITPKLLSGLRYDERMRVHTIVSGEHVDSRGTEKMNFANFVNIQRRLAVR
ncbi:P-loop containing nucleoside triphosphate hydrolase protein [Chaetomium fimeti]|uniref:Structural maintenance of chromosomes protein 5 n=1 Tax=Chaetomium fimeti TaxID=1854472 RepID=A0AAE0HKJ0_9PEZI|nr:P-loop containing nucleoside triphosphate hydrolase protein [Chaetomium fimeti]